MTEDSTGTRLRELAYDSALSAHMTDPHGHTFDFGTCPHPDCVLVRSAVEPAPTKANRFDCKTCGKGIAVDEDGCCRTCGADAISVEAGRSAVEPDLALPTEQPADARGRF